MPAARSLRAGQRLPYWRWLPATAALGLLLWVLVAVVQYSYRPVPAPQERVAGQRQELREGVLPLAAVVSDPSAHLDRTVSGTAAVAQVVSDRSFWLEQNGHRVFAVVFEPAPEARDLYEGQRVRVAGRMLDAYQAVGMPGATTLESGTFHTLSQERAFLLVERFEFATDDLESAAEE